jgi:hypothetical protein
MTQTEQAILDTLVGLEDAVATMKTAQPKPDLAAIFRRLDELASQLPRETDPELRHYLQRKSYQKARQWLQGVDPEKGTCRK